MRKVLIFVGVAAALALVVQAADAVARSVSGKVLTMTEEKDDKGKVKAIVFTIEKTNVTVYEIPDSFVITPATQIIDHLGKPRTAKEIQVGVQVKVEYEDNGSKKARAVMVHVKVTK